MFKFVVFSCGALLLFTSLFSIFSRKNCTQLVQAFYIGEQAYKSSTSVTLYTIKFQFIYKGQSFTNYSIDTFSKSKLQKKFQSGKQYTIYINPTKPTRICTNKSISPSDIFCFILGIGFILGGFLL